MRSFRGVVVVAAAAAVVTVAGCTSQSAITATTSTALSTLASTAESTASSAPLTSSTAVSSRSASSTATLAPTTQPAATSPDATSATAGPWPSDLTPAQVEDAKAATAAYIGYTAFVDRAYADPSADWSAEVKQWAAGPVADRFLANIAGTAELGQYTTGQLAVEPTVTRVQTALVDIEACVDASGLGFFNRDGVSIKAPDAPGSYFRHPSKVQVGQFEGGQWLVQSMTDDYTVQC